MSIVTIRMRRRQSTLALPLAAMSAPTIPIVGSRTTASATCRDQNSLIPLPRNCNPIPARGPRIAVVMNATIVRHEPRIPSVMPSKMIARMSETTNSRSELVKKAEVAGLHQWPWSRSGSEPVPMSQTRVPRVPKMRPDVRASSRISAVTAELNGRERIHLPTAPVDALSRARPPAPDAGVLLNGPAPDARVVRVELVSAHHAPCHPAVSATNGTRKVLREG